MEVSNEQKNDYIKRLFLSRTRILCNHPFFGLLLMHIKFSLDEMIETAATDGEYIIFGEEFLNSINDKELDFVLMHEIMHLALKHCWRGKNFNQELFNIACDIVVNSNILFENNNDLNSITIKAWGEACMHIAPDGNEGYNYTAEEVYYMLLSNCKKNKNGCQSYKGKADKNKNGKSKGNQGFDDHSYWNKNKDNNALGDIWEKRVKDASDAIEGREGNSCRGTVPLFAKRVLQKLKTPELDWREILSNFIQEEIVDYSFMPPDKRFDSEFFLPAFNEKEDKVDKILFMIDTSGSISDSMMTNAYSEIKGAIDQFDGKLEGWLGFFDAAIIKPIPFNDEFSFNSIKPMGGGGTDFEIIFKYVKENMLNDLPVSIIILTDGFAPFPNEKEALDIPVLWVINNKVITPPWGKVARISNGK